MSAASRGREQAKRRQVAEDAARTYYADLPEPGGLPVPIEDDPELARLLAWWCRDHGKVADEMGFRSLVVTSEGVLGRRKPAPMDPGIAAAIAVAFGGMGRAPAGEQRKGVNA